MPGWAEDYASYEEFEEWARCEKEAMKRNAPGWGWPTPDGSPSDGEAHSPRKASSPLEDLFNGPANLRVLRLLWTEDKFCWPTQIARRTHLSRSSVHAALGRLLDWGMVERIPAWDSNRTFAYRLYDPHPLVRELGRLFLVEAGLRGGWAR